MALVLFGVSFGLVGFDATAGVAVDVVPTVPVLVWVLSRYRGGGRLRRRRRRRGEEVT